MLAMLFAVLALLSAALMIWQWVAGVAFAFNIRNLVPGTLPKVSVLKPVKSMDPGTEEALESWFQQKYPGTCEIVFGVEESDESSATRLRTLLSQFPKARARVVTCPRVLGPNRKVSNLIQMVGSARGDILVVSDADVIAPPDLVAQMAGALLRPEVGLVHCLYRLANGPTAATRWEAFIVNADFWSQVLQNKTLGPLKYALGAAMAFRREDLDAVGGFERLSDVLADDNRLGRLIVGLGKRTELCPLVVDCRVGAAGWLESWRHQLRWAVTIRVCQGLPYFLSILANGTFWPLLWVAVAPSPVSIAGASIAVSLRILQGLSLEGHFTRRRPDWARWWIVPLKDLLQVLLWGTAMLKRHVIWRGHRFRVLRDGRLRPAERVTAGSGA